MSENRPPFLSNRPDLQKWWQESIAVVRSVAAGGGNA